MHNVAEARINQSHVSFFGAYFDGSQARGEGEAQARRAGRRRRAKDHLAKEEHSQRSCPVSNRSFKSANFIVFRG